MVNSFSAGSLSESARERETFKYDALAITTAGLNGTQPAHPIPSTFLGDTQDPALTAFAQLGLYRLNAGRANISLFDRTHQHIVAEALRPIPSELEEKQQPAWFNGLTFERESSICEHVVTGSAGSQFVPGTDFGLSVDDIPVSIIKSLDTDARFCHIQDPGRQFYAGVPIRSPEGINIGVYCVFDDMPRPQGLTDDEIRFIREISRVVMDYLEIKRSSEWHRREQRMLRGLGSFVRGKPTLWKPAEGALDNHVSIRDRPGISEGQLNKKLQSGRTQAGDGQEKQQEQEKPEPETPGSEIPTAEHHSPGQNGADAPLITTARTDFAEVLDNPTTPTKRLKLARVLSSSADQLSNKMDDVFSKAANVIRESVEIEGVLFLDAAVHSYGGLVGSVSSNTPNQSGGRHSSTTQSSGDEAVRNPNCNVLGFSTSRTSSVVGDAIPNEFTRCREWFLQRLLQRYPLGNVWNFDADGSVSDHTTDSEDSPIPGRKMHTSPAATEPINEAGAAVAPHKTKKRISTAARIVEMFPGARSVAVVPLWDAQTGRWFAGGFAWTQTPTRTFSEENELIYMRVFGLAAMTEIARLKMRAADKAKTDILGSISHELRSPLHGLVGAVELLRHTDLDALQDGILRTIEASGRTLLDTIDHLLDFVKINAKQSSKARRRSRTTSQRQSSNPPSPEMASLPPTPIQLDLLVEEVVESVLAGSSYLTKSETHSPLSFTTTRGPVVDGPSSGPLLKPKAGVQLDLDIQHPAQWAFVGHPGAFRRIVMNLVGNALKFTTTGFIRVSLRQEEPSIQSAAAGMSRVVLSVSDSGRGMSDDYLRNHLFTPFSQEDSFAPGTGLGLSLVRNMAVAQGGTIDVSSKVGQGTTVTIVLPFQLATYEAIDRAEIDFWKDVETLSGRRVQLHGFEREARIRKSFCAEDSKRKSQYHLTESICRDVLRMDVLPDRSDGSDVPDVVICLVSDDGLGLPDAESLKQAAHCPYMFVCRDLASAKRLTDSRRGDLPKVFEICSQPVGPRKLATTLLACQQRWQVIQRDSAVPVRDQEAIASDVGTQQLSETTTLEPLAVDETGKLSQLLQGAVITAPEPSASSEVQNTTILAQPNSLRQPASVLLTETTGEDIDATSKNPDLAKPILIVDDNNVNLKIMAAYLTKLKYTYTTAMNGLEALEIYTKSPGKYSCMLTDISMPVMDGLESTRQIREFENAGGHSPVAVIALTGLSGPEVRQNALASGVDLFLTRPLPLRGLREALATVGLSQ